uniref:Uncharacterized protein n=1 Tax=Anopheles melas TaxID=34690 RepID=A0A182TTR4_9DIPT
MLGLGHGLPTKACQPKVYHHLTAVLVKNLVIIFGALDEPMVGNLPLGIQHGLEIVIKSCPQLPVEGTHFAFCSITSPSFTYPCPPSWRSFSRSLSRASIDHDCSSPDTPNQ